MNTKLRASVEKSKLFEEIFQSERDSLFGEFFKRGMEKLLQESLEQEVTENQALLCAWGICSTARSI